MKQILAIGILGLTSTVSAQLCFTESISTGFGHTCAQSGARSVTCWGNNQNGELGIGEDTDGIYMPKPDKEKTVDFEDRVVQVEVGASSTCVVLETGHAVCWGANWLGQLGLDDFETRYSPDGPVNLDEPVKQIVIGESHTCALMNDTTTVKCWGQSDNGVLGVVHDGQPDTVFASQSESIDFNTTEKIVKLEVGDFVTCALFESGRVKCWGGFSKWTDEQIQDTPTDWIPLESEVSDLSIGRDFLCFVMVDGMTTCFDSDMMETNIDHKFISIDSGRFHTCGVSAEEQGMVYCWGDNGFGQCGHSWDLSDMDFEQPVLVTGLRYISDIAAGAYHTCARLEQGRVKCWGANWYGQLGYGDNEPIRVPRTWFVPVCDFENPFDVLCSNLGPLKCNLNKDCTWHQKECRSWEFGDQCLMNKRRCKKSDKCMFDSEQKRCILK